MINSAADVSDAENYSLLDITNFSNFEYSRVTDPEDDNEEKHERKIKCTTQDTQTYLTIDPKNNIIVKILENGNHDVIEDCCKEVVVSRNPTNDDDGTTRIPLPRSTPNFKSPANTDFASKNLSLNTNELYSLEFSPIAKSNTSLRGSNLPSPSSIIKKGLHSENKDHYKQSVHFDENIDFYNESDKIIHSSPRNIEGIAMHIEGSRDVSHTTPPMRDHLTYTSPHIEDYDETADFTLRSISMLVDQSSIHPSEDDHHPNPATTTTFHTTTNNHSTSTGLLAEMNSPPPSLRSRNTQQRLPINPGSSNTLIDNVTYAERESSHHYSTPVSNRRHSTASYPIEDPFVEPRLSKTDPIIHKYKRNDTPTTSSNDFQHYYFRAIPDTQDDNTDRIGYSSVPRRGSHSAPYISTNSYHYQHHKLLPTTTTTSPPFTTPYTTNNTLHPKIRSNQSSQNSSFWRTRLQRRFMTSAVALFPESKSASYL